MHNIALACDILRLRMAGENSPRRGIPALDAGDKKFRTPLVKRLDTLSRISKETFHADFP